MAHLKQLRGPPVEKRCSSPRKSKSGQYVKDVRIISPKCSFFTVARWFEFTNFITEKQNSQKYVVLCTSRK